MWWQCHPSVPLPWLACPGTTVTVTSVHRRRVDNAAWIIFLRCLRVSVVLSQLPPGAARLGLAPVPIGMVRPDGTSLLLLCFGPSVLTVLKISKKFAREAMSACCGSLWCAAGWPSSYQTASACVSAPAECACEGTAFVHSWDSGSSWLSTTFLERIETVVSGC